MEPLRVEGTTVMVLRALVAGVRVWVCLNAARAPACSHWSIEKQGKCTQIPRPQAETRRMRRWDVLWSVFDLSLRWRQLQRLKAQRRRVIEGLEAATEDETLQQRYRACVDALDQATSSEVRAGDVRKY